MPNNLSNCMLMEFYLKVSYLLRISVQGTLIEFLMIFYFGLFEEPKENNDSQWSEFSQYA